MYNLQLKKLRKKAGYKSQSEMAEALKIPERRYASWERQEVGLNLEQACMVADVLDCTLDELAGREAPIGWTDVFQAELNRCYEACTDDRKASILQMARDGALASGEDAQRAVDEAEEFVSDEIECYRRAQAGEKVTKEQIADAVASDARREASMSERNIMRYEIWKARELARLTGRKASA